jgi:hypothetical protein
MIRVLPVVLLLGLYWPGLTNWFYQDDFGWLRLRQEVHSAADLAPALFAPKAHGNMRPLGENAYWLGLSSLFGAVALPFRITAFVTQIASLLLLGSIVQQLTGSRAGAFCAQVLWIASCGLAPAMAWSSIYNQVLSGFFFLLALFCLQRRMYAAHWAAFVLGLGALETNVVYPAIAAVYALLYDRSLLRKIAPMFAVSALYVWVHFQFAGSQPGVYAMHFDGALPHTLWTYWSWGLGQGPLAGVLVLTAGVTALAVWRARNRDYLPLFGLAWFAIVLAPYLPLRDHLMDYYLAAPAIGIAMVGAVAAARAPRVAAGAGIAVYLAMSIPAGWTATRWNHERSRVVEDFVKGVDEIRRHNPGKIILVNGVDTGLFQTGVADVPFLALEIPYVYLAPGSEREIQEPPDLVKKFELPEGLAYDAVRGGEAVVYRVDRGVLRNETARYQSMAAAVWRPGPPRFVNLGDPVYDRFLGAGWERASNGYRTLRQAGSLRMGGGETLEIGIFRPQGVAPRIRVDGIEKPLELAAANNEISVFRTKLAGAGEWIGVAIEVGAPTVFGYLEAR